MSHHLVRCPYCAKRFNISGIESGTRLQCGGCRAILSVPGAGAPAPRRFNLKLSATIAGAFLVSAVLVRAFWPEPPAVRTDAPDVVTTPPAPKPPASGGSAGIIPAPSVTAPAPVVTWNLRYQASKTVLFNEFQSRMVTHDGTRPYLVAVEQSRRYIAYDVAVEYARWLEALLSTFRRDFGEPLGLDEVDEPLVVIVFKSRESFDAYCLRKENQRLSEQIKGIYQYTDRRIVLYHGAESPSVVLFHEGVHQLVDHYARKAGSSPRSRTYWFQEGLGTYYEGFGRGSEGRLGTDPGVSRERLWIIKQALLRDRSSFISLGVLVGMTVDEFWAWYEQGGQKEPEETARKAQLYYAESWAFVHFLCRKGGNYRKAFEEFFLSELEGGAARATDRKERFEGIVRDRLGMELSHLEDEFITYVLNLR